MELLQKQAVERVQNPGTPGFYSRLFLVSKNNGKIHPVIDLSLLNQYIQNGDSYQLFKMETVKSVRQSILVNNRALSIDLTDAYFQFILDPGSTFDSCSTGLPIHGPTL